MSRDLATGGGTNFVRLGSRACADARSNTPPERANSSPSAPHVDAFVSRAALVELLTQERYETDSGYPDLNLAQRRAWNDRANSLLKWLGVEPAPLERATVAEVSV